MQIKERNVILPVTIGGLIEFYEIYLYAYWTPILISAFYKNVLTFTESFITGLLFILMLVSRPLGGLIFGYLGDRFGRKFALVLSIGVISLFSFAAAALSPSWGGYIILYIGIIKFIQGIPAGGEIPAAICLLSESAYSEKRRRFLCSFVLIGPQIGQILSMTQCLLMEKYYSHEFLIEWGWRISFIIAGLIGLIGVLLRSKLHESPSFQHMQANSEVSSNPIMEAFRYYKKKLVLAFFISIFEVTGFFMIAFFLVEHFSTVFDVPKGEASWLNILFLIPIVFIQPLIGKLAENYRPKPLCILSAVIVILISYPFYLSILHASHAWSLAFLGILILSLCVQFALIPSLLASMFPPTVRFTGIGFSFNLCNSIVGGLAPLLGDGLIQTTGNLATFVVIYPIAALVFLCTIPFISEFSLQQK